jgi:hypothetical protein
VTIWHYQAQPAIYEDRKKILSMTPFVTRYITDTYLWVEEQQPCIASGSHQALATRQQQQLQQLTARSSSSSITSSSGCGCLPAALGWPLLQQVAAAAAVVCVHTFAC